MKISDLRVDATKRNEGDWVDIPDYPGMRLKVRHINNVDYRKGHSLAYQRLLRKYGKRPVPPEESDKLTADLLHKHVLLDWEGIEDEQGKPIKYDADKAYEWLHDPDMEAFANAVAWAASVVGEDYDEQLEEDAKN